MDLIVFENAEASKFYPLSVSHPVYDLMFGCFDVVERLKRYFKPNKLFLVCRDYLADISRQKYACPVNDLRSVKNTSILINAALKPDYRILDRIAGAKENTTFYSGKNFVAAKLTPDFVAKTPITRLPEQAITFSKDIKQSEIEAELFRYLWDIVDYNGKAVNWDVSKFWACEQPEKPYKQFNVSKSDVYIHPSAEISGGAFIDASGGPVVIDESVVIEPRSLIQGPVYIGKGTRLMAGVVRGACSLGPVCKIGGELDQSIILGYSNKSHDGFIGHSYIGEWVNLGAMTTNSDLKNNYSEVTVSINGKDIPTGLIKVGSFIGDHTKTGIGTLLNTGMVIGFCCNLYGGSLFSQKEISHFRWGTPDTLVEFKLDKAMQIAKAVMMRRGINFSVANEELFNMIGNLKS